MKLNENKNIMFSVNVKIQSKIYQQIDLMQIKVNINIYFKKKIALV